MAPRGRVEENAPGLPAVRPEVHCCSPTRARATINRRGVDAGSGSDHTAGIMSDLTVQDVFSVGVLLF